MYPAFYTLPRYCRAFPAYYFTFLAMQRTIGFSQPSPGGVSNRREKRRRCSRARACVAAYLTSGNLTQLLLLPPLHTFAFLNRPEVSAVRGAKVRRVYAASWFLQFPRSRRFHDPARDSYSHFFLHCSRVQPHRRG